MEIHHEVNPLKLTLKNKIFESGKYALHWHEKLEFALALNKPFDVIIEGKRCEVFPGDVLIIGERVLHLFDIKEDETEVRIGQFPYSALLGAGITPQPIKPHIKRCELEKDSDLCFKVDGIISTISRENAVSDEENPFLQMMFSALYFLLMSRFTLEDNSSLKKEKREFYKIVEYANEHFKEGLTIQEIAKKLYIDRGRLSQLFLKYSGVSLMDYLNALRVAHAAELIKSGATITAAALESGFRSVRTFNEVYRRHVKSAPSKIKKHKGI